MPEESNKKVPVKAQKVVNLLPEKVEKIDELKTLDKLCFITNKRTVEEIIKDSAAFVSHAREVRLRGNIPKYAQATITEQLARKFGMVYVCGVYVKKCFDNKKVCIGLPGNIIEVINEIKKTELDEREKELKKKA